MRASDGPPHLVINMADTPKRPEIPVKDFCQGLELEPTVVLQFDGETFGHASNNGQMLEELNAQSTVVEQIHELSLILTHRQEFAPSSKPKGGALAPLLSKLPFKL